jgi:hypothetical protein
MQTTKLWGPHLQHLERYRQEEAGKPRSSELPTGWHHPSREQKIEGKLRREDHATIARVRCAVARIVWRGSSTRHVHRDPLNRSLSPNPKDWTSSPALTWTSRNEPPSVQSVLHYKIDGGVHDGKMGSLWSAFTLSIALRQRQSPVLLSSVQAWAAWKPEYDFCFEVQSREMQYKQSYCLWRKIPKRRYLFKNLATFFFSQRQVAKLGESRPHVCFLATLLMALYKAVAQLSGNQSGETPLSLHHKIERNKKNTCTSCSPEFRSIMSSLEKRTYTTWVLCSTK